MSSSQDINIEKATASEFYAQKAPYSSIGNTTVSLITNPDALAIWVYLQTRSSGWKVIGSHLQDRFELGRTRYRAAMKCLRDLRLITHEIVRDGARAAGSRIIVHYQPEPIKEPVKQAGSLDVQVPAPSETQETLDVPFSDYPESVDVTKTTPYLIKDLNTKQEDKEPNGAGAPSDDGFDLAWKVYPKREGANPKNKAQSCWSARLKEGVTAEHMLAGVARYAAYCKAKGSVGTEYVMQAMRFFGKEQAFNNEWTASSVASAKQSNITQDFQNKQYNGTPDDQFADFLQQD